MREWLGLGLGFAGVVVLIGGASTHGDTTHLVLLLLSPAAWGVGSIIARRMPGPSAAWQMIVGGIAVGAIALGRGERVTPRVPERPRERS